MTYMRRLFGGVALVSALAVSAAGCDPKITGDIDTPTVPTVPTTESFSGTLTVNGAQTFGFQALSSGFVQATLKVFTPQTDAKVGLSIGTFNGVTCATTPALSNDDAGQGITVTASVATAATLCVRIYDSKGQITGPNSFEITVIHP